MEGYKLLAHHLFSRQDIWARTVGSGRGVKVCGYGEERKERKGEEKQNLLILRPLKKPRGHSCLSGVGWKTGGCRLRVMKSREVYCVDLVLKCASLLLSRRFYY